MILFPLPLPLFTPIIIIIIIIIVAVVVGRCAACAAVNDAVPFAFSFGFAAEEVVVVAVTVDYWPPLGFWRRRGFGVHGPGMARCCGTSSPSPAKGTWCHDCCYATLALRLGGCHASRAAPRWLPLRGAAQRRPGAGAGDQAQAEAWSQRRAGWRLAVGAHMGDSHLGVNRQSWEKHGTFVYRLFDLFVPSTFSAPPESVFLVRLYELLDSYDSLSFCLLVPTP